MNRVCSNPACEDPQSTTTYRRRVNGNYYCNKCGQFLRAHGYERQPGRQHTAALEASVRAATAAAAATAVNITAATAMQPPAVPVAQSSTAQQATAPAATATTDTAPATPDLASAATPSDAEDSLIL